ncbi:MAG: hypothetical protein HY870_07640 [Chloroflexi bacterium]|nr:hypothetical protein [Chloroflexota bacterium]
MKLRYFSYIAEQSFKTSPSGDRLFYYFGGVWSRPYIIPNEETEKRLFKKRLWVSRIFIGALILGQPFLFVAVPNLLTVPQWWILYLIAVGLLSWLVNWLAFRRELPLLKRANQRLSLLSYFRDTARRHSKFWLFLGFVICIGFVVAGLWMVATEHSAFIGWVNIIFFGLCAIAWGYSLYLKSTTPTTDDVSERKTEA